MVTTGDPEPGIDNLLRTVVTDENGEYYCTSLPTGQYIVKVFDALSFDEVDDGTVITGSTADHRAKPWTYALMTASPNLTADFGVTGSNSLSGKVFIENEDLLTPDGSGTVDAGELDGTTSPTGGPADPNDVSADAPAEAVLVELYIQQPGGGFSLVTTTTTDANGDYNFSGLPDGTYRVEVKPAGTVIDGFGQTGDPDLVANALGNGNEDLVCDSPTTAQCDDASVQTLTGGTDVSGVDFGYQRDFVTTPVTLTYFSASATSGGVLFEWESMNEVGHFGYQLYARVNEDWVLINELPIVGDASQDALSHRSYEYFASMDAVQWVSLVDVSTSEVLTVHGPFELGDAYGARGSDVADFDWAQVPSAPSVDGLLRNATELRLQRLRQLDGEPELFEELEQDDDATE